METYPPIGLVNTKLNPSELHYHSYTISPLRQLFNSYYRFVEYYTLHFTSERIIIEPYINYDILINFYKVYSYLPLPENLLVIINKSRINTAKNSVEIIKYKSISLLYTMIESIDIVKINGSKPVQIRLKELDDNYEIKAFKMLEFDVFDLYKVQKLTFESFKKIFDTPDYNNANSDFSFGASLFVKVFSKEISSDTKL
ncbi:hypothetical protein [Nostoc sp.]|uniref:hypothetical protein n=1 Tax=Nostoc sp. TaxID=1180 RepID=UPI002FFA87FB